MFKVNYWILALIVGLFCLAACGGDGDSPLPTGERREVTSTPTTPESDRPTVVPVSSDERVRLEMQYETLRQAQDQLETIWSDLKGGQTVQCSADLPRLIAPDAISGQDEASLALRRAAAEIDTAISLWAAECRNPRPQPPPEIIDRGLRAALAAGDALREAEQALSD